MNDIVERMENSDGNDPTLMLEACNIMEVWRDALRLIATQKGEHFSKAVARRALEEKK